MNETFVHVYLVSALIVQLMVFMSKRELHKDEREMLAILAIIPGLNTIVAAILLLCFVAGFAAAAFKHYKRRDGSDI